MDDPDGWNAWGTVAPVETAQSSAIGALHAAMCALCRFCRCLWCAHAIWLGVAGRASPDEPAQGSGPANGVDHFAISVNPAPERTSTDTWGAADSSWDGDDGWDDGDGARRSSALSALSAVSKPLCTAHTVADCRSGGRWPGMGRQLGFPTKSQIRCTAAAAADIAERHSQDAEEEHHRDQLRHVAICFCASMQCQTEPHSGEAQSRQLLRYRSAHSSRGQLGRSHRRTMRTR